MDRPRLTPQPRLDPGERRVYEEALDALEGAGLRCMLGGAVALHAHTGIWRDTKDLDVFVTAGEVWPVLGALAGAGYATRVEDPVWLAKAHKDEGLLDIIHANDNGTNPVTEEWYARAHESTFAGRRVRVISPEEMILSKIFVASRDRWDLSDVLHLIFAHRGELDWSRILSGMGDHWELLLAYLHLYRYVYPSHAHHVPLSILEELLERYSQEVAPERLRFRGTMLDSVSFWVDVEDWGLPDERAENRGEK